jgi:hypothetical protein
MAYMDREASPTLHPVPDMDLASYKHHSLSGSPTHMFAIRWRGFVRSLRTAFQNG